MTIIVLNVQRKAINATDFTAKHRKNSQPPEYRKLAEDKILKQQWSPEQLSHRLKQHSRYEERRGKIQISHPLEERPRSAENRSRLGHWELDTVLGKAGKACLMTANDRKSRFTIVKKLPNKSAKAVVEALIEVFDGHHLRSLTPDRGKEFARHTDVASVLGVEFYFPEPHQPWQRGTNENTNGLLREYFPKQQDISPWNEDEIQAVVDKLNLRPRKCLG